MKSRKTRFEDRFNDFNKQHKLQLLFPLGFSYPATIGYWVNCVLSSLYQLIHTHTHTQRTKVKSLISFSINNSQPHASWLPLQSSSTAAGDNALQSSVCSALLFPPSSTAHDFLFINSGNALQSLEFRLFTLHQHRSPLQSLTTT